MDRLECWPVTERSGGGPSTGSGRTGASPPFGLSPSKAPAERRPTYAGLRRSQHAGLAFLTLALFLVLPGHPLSFVGGLPWGPLGLGCAVLLGVGLFAAWPLQPSAWASRLGPVALALAGFKLVLALAAPRYGLEASYYANDR